MDRRPHRSLGFRKTRRRARRRQWRQAARDGSARPFRRSRLRRPAIYLRPDRAKCRALITEALHRICHAKVTKSARNWSSFGPRLVLAACRAASGAFSQLAFANSGKTKTEREEAAVEPCRIHNFAPTLSQLQQPACRALAVELPWSRLSSPCAGIESSSRGGPWQAR